MKFILQKLFRGELLSKAQADTAMQAITSGSCNDSEAVAFMIAMNMRKLSVDELSGFCDSLMRLATPVQLKAPCILDLCGTGGDGKESFNISTTAAFVAVACGLPVAKHGNYGSSSSCGSSTVLEALGVPLPQSAIEAEACFSDCGVVFLHAPYFHPALKRVAPLRKALGCRTFFNILGPLLNPARPTHQVTGVFSSEVQRLYSHIFTSGQWTDYALVHSLDGYDELTFTSDARIISRQGLFEVAPSSAMPKLREQQLAGGRSAHESAALVESILCGDGTEAQNQVVAGNVALALMITGGDSFNDGYAMARECIESGSALKYLNQLRQWKSDGGSVA
jgi:anthranilate phosphoribosyltransferase